MDQTLTPQYKRAEARRFYDAVMSLLEPELVLESIPTLDAKYAGESAADHEKRMQRYKAAYAKFDSVVLGLSARVHATERNARRVALHEEEQKSQSDDQSRLQGFEQAFQ